MERIFYVADAFTSERFSGNPAGVVIDAVGLDESEMQSIAAEFNHSETTFVLPIESGKGNGANGGHAANFRFRWFTPTVEATMCGHATLAGVHALVEAGRIPWDESHDAVSVGLETLSGALTGFVERMPSPSSGRMIWLELRPPKLKSLDFNPTEIVSALRLTDDDMDSALPPATTQDFDLICFVRDVRTLHQARPDHHRLNEILMGRGLRGMSLATVKTLSPSIHVQSRFFAAPVGIDEDPVTGSVHGPLAAYLVREGVVKPHDGVSAMMCIQGKSGGRTGLVYALVEPRPGGEFNVRIGGQVVTTMRGVLHLS